MSKLLRLIIFISILASCFIGCFGGSTPPALSLHGTFDFGTVTVGTSKTTTLVVKNDSNQKATLGTVTADSLGIKAPFSWDATSKDCASKGSIAAGSQCTITVTFTPVSEGPFEFNFTLNYTGSKGHATLTKKISAQGFLDCTKSSELAAGYAQGVSDGKAKNQSESQSGTTAGKALTYNDGYQAGYKKAYHSAYTAAYNIAYSNGYSDGDSQGLINGENDQLSCQNGTYDGNSAGNIDGQNDGTYNGYNDGYHDGYAAGYSDGYNAGYSDGANSCSAQPASSSQSITPGSIRATISGATDPLTSSSNVAACNKKGFDATYNPNSYWNAYNAAAAANTNYQNGLSVGMTAGQNDGTNNGKSDGYAAGLSDGQAAGYAKGTQIAYNDCYTSAYNTSYKDSYDTAYNDPSDGYPVGYSDGNNDGYNQGYDDGYNQGQSDYCTPTSYMLLGQSGSGTDLHAWLKPLKLYGSKQVWARVARQSIVVDTHVEARIPRNVYATKDARQKLMAFRLKTAEQVANMWQVTLRDKAWAKAIKTNETVLRPNLRVLIKKVTR